MTRPGAWLVLIGCVGLACALPAQGKDPKPGKQDAQQEAKLPDPLTRESVRELVSRNLSRLQAEGIIQIDGRSLIVPDLKALEAELESAP